VLRSTGAATGTNRLYRVEEMPALPTTVPRTILKMPYRASSTAQLRCFVARHFSRCLCWAPDRNPEFL